MILYSHLLHRVESAVQSKDQTETNRAIQNILSEVSKSILLAQEILEYSQKNKSFAQISILINVVFFEFYNDNNDLFLKIESLIQKNSNGDQMTTHLSLLKQIEEALSAIVLISENDNSYNKEHIFEELRHATSQLTKYIKLH